MQVVVEEFEQFVQIKVTKVGHSVVPVVVRVVTEDSTAKGVTSCQGVARVTNSRIKIMLLHYLQLMLITFLFPWR